MTSTTVNIICATGLYKENEGGFAYWHFTRGQPFPRDMLAAMDPDILFNPTHFHRNIIPRLLQRGATREQIDVMLRDNPRRYFAGEA